MKKSLFVGILTLVILAVATVVFAADDSALSISITNTNTNTVQATGGEAYEEPSRLIIAMESGLPDELKIVLTDIQEVNAELVKCKKLSYGNLLLRGRLSFFYKKAYEITGDVWYLERAIEHAQIAERNFQRGSDIRQNQSKANQTIMQVYHHWAYCIWQLKSKAAAQEFAAAKGIQVF